MEFEVEFYETVNGHAPVREFVLKDMSHEQNEL
jgi:hypothetical protein